MFYKLPGDSLSGANGGHLGHHQLHDGMTVPVSRNGLETSLS